MGFAESLDQFGRLPPVKLEVRPLDARVAYNKGRPYTIDRFTTYSFSSNILIPVDTFTFTFRPLPPNKADRTSYYDRVAMPGDIVQLTVDGGAISTGYIDDPASETDTSGGALLTRNGRDLMGFLEDNDAVNPDSSILWANAGTSIQTVLDNLLRNTRITGREFRGVPESVKSLFATNPGESKLAALQRFLDPLNALVWMSPTGKLICGRPAFDSPALGTLGVRMFDRDSNVLRIRAQRGAARIPNAMLSIWTGNEQIQTIHKRDLKINQADEPARLYKAGHRIYRTIATSAPNANDTSSGFAEINRYLANGANYLDSLAARELARENVNELLVTCTVVGHLNEEGDPYAPDTCYHVVYDAEGIDEKMYLFGVEYAMSENAGQVTHLSFCKLNRIVAEAPTR